MSYNIYENGQLNKIAGRAVMDAELDANSTNGVQNKVVTEAITQLNNDLGTLIKIKANSFSGTTDAYGNISVPTNIIKPSTGHILSADINNGFCLVGISIQNDGYFIRCLNSDQTLTNKASSNVVIWIRYCI